MSLWPCLNGSNGYRYCILYRHHQESSSENASRPVNSLSEGFSDSIWRTMSGLRLCANINPSILGSVKIGWTSHIDIVSVECSRSPASSKYDCLFLKLLLEEHDFEKVLLHGESTLNFRPQALSIVITKFKLASNYQHQQMNAWRTMHLHIQN